MTAVFADLTDPAPTDLTPEQKKRQLYEKQKQLLNTFLERRAISQAQYDKSLHDLTEKMGYGELPDT